MVNSKILKDQHQYYRLLNTLFVVLPTTFTISVLSVFIKEVPDGKWIEAFFKSWAFSLPVAYVCVLLFLPVAHKITGIILKED
ncbi:DUF2798 domain-containing protein [Chryseobacterium sp. c4a]|uniref:DUF2798 domain-containing protein n=1 Tax=Chryseobacterium sp. c4a TaxID=1573582 RepID=UPI00135BD154|nr:DUF2798 domain-containing protein [Chryseobacterium sp. c4a]